MCIKTGFNIPEVRWWKRICLRIVSLVEKRLQAVLTCGLTPQKLAQTLCVGAALGIMPLLWGTSLLCLLLAHYFRLNQIALQSVNYLLYPVQLALLVPFFKLGTWLFPWGPQVPQNMLSVLFRTPGLPSLNILGWITLKSLTAWLVTALPLALLAYGILWVTSSRIRTQVPEA
jgi:uncharacterized protein (DUF2062 family)